ncbi:MAG: hypothetical protein ACREMW_03480 [Gemmatimonadales bacterium]
MKRAVGCLVTLAALACSIDSGTAPTIDVISTAEKAAVQQALAQSFGSDSLYALLSGFVVPFIDQATPFGNAPGDTTKIAAFQLDAAAGSITAGVFGVLAWRGYRSASETVDSVFLVVGAGTALPLDDSLSETFAVNLLGAGTAWVIAEAPDSSVQTWLARTGALHIANATFGASSTVDLGGGFSITRARGTIVGDYHLSAKLVPDSSTTVTAAQAFASGVHGVHLVVAGPLP